MAHNVRVSCAVLAIANTSDGYLWVQYWFLFLAGIGIWIWPAIIFFRGGF